MDKYDVVIKYTNQPYLIKAEIIQMLDLLKPENVIPFSVEEDECGFGFITDTAAKQVNNNLDDLFPILKQKTNYWNSFNWNDLHVVLIRP